ncbi:hypothetical protein BG006_008144 [Podila minutissima]|uniref:Crinkler effector protein N-terminal domain-containing protein n=1 Tax=Podila minutissima TaxID=64525 RepID=A0A9P5SK59_9FUNG|nr:hypothetical protein BG006_008144 [Podila minutissima]
MLRNAMTDNNLTFFCVIDGESTPFPVEIEPTKTIGELKKTIKDDNAVAFADVDAKMLTLWGVSIPVAPKKERKDISLAGIPSKEELDETDDVSDVFKETPPKKTIHIIVQRPPPVAAARKHTLSEAFPKGLPYRGPQPLLRTTGLDWTYQPDPNLYDTLRQAIKGHYSAFFHGRRDKSTIPLYLFLCGAGTGKSRNAQEFHQSATACLIEDEDRELRKRIEDAWVFHVSLENGVSLLENEVSPIEAIGCRMLLQLLPDKRLRNVMQDYKELHPMNVLDLVAKGTGQHLRDATVILVVDGLQSFMTDPKDGHDKDSAFYRALTNIGDLAFEDVFLMACCTATDGSLKPVFDEDDHIIKVLVSDCGGHGRALESLQQAIEASSKDYNVESLMNSLYYQLQDLYSEAVSFPSSTIQAMARAILTRAHLDPDKPVPGTARLPGELAIPGLIRYEQPTGLGTGGYLTAPYIWVWLFSHQSRDDVDPLLNSWRFYSYPDLKSKTDPKSPPGAQFWQHFEHFAATFCCLKSRCEHETLNVHKGEHCILNAAAAPFGDSFTGLDTRPFCTEVHQYKLIADGRRIDYQAEREKAASDKDFFILFTSKDRLNVALPPMSGIVDRSNWALYFGPFAGRAFVFATTGALDINKAPRKDLKRMRDVDERKADLIIQERTKRLFDSYDDATQRLRGVGKTVLKGFKFPRTA